jgi:hypothetical protein
MRALCARLLSFVLSTAGLTRLSMLSFCLTLARTLHTPAAPR